MDFDQLIEQAKEINGKFVIGKKASAGRVSAAIQAGNGEIYTGICLKIPCGIGFCAEHSAIAEMLKDRETQIIRSVAIIKGRVLPPCGRCRELMMLIDEKNRDAEILIEEGKVISLGELMPHHWMDSRSK